MASRPQPEHDLVVRARQGDARAFADLMRPFEEIAFRSAYVITRDATDAEEAAQDALIKAYRHFRRFRPGAPVRPWLLAIVVNEAKNRRRSAARRSALVVRAAAQVPLGDAAPSPEGALLAAEERQRLLLALDTLPESQKLVVTCRYLLDLGEQETATVLGIRSGTVKSRLSRALERLQGELNP